MINIASHVHQYVPMIEYQNQTRITSNNTTVDVTEDNSVLHSILFGGDKLTAARLRGANKRSQMQFHYCSKATRRPNSSC